MRAELVPGQLLAECGVRHSQVKTFTLWAMAAAHSSQCTSSQPGSLEKPLQPRPQQETKNEGSRDSHDARRQQQLYSSA